MDALKAFRALPANELRDSERERLLLRLNDLLAFLGSPGDWGYGTKLGALTQILFEQRSAIVAQPMGAAK